MKTFLIAAMTVLLIIVIARRFEPEKQIFNQLGDKLYFLNSFTNNNFSVFGIAAAFFRLKDL
jgi:hypothetical protein